MKSPLKWSYISYPLVGQEKCCQWLGVMWEDRQILDLSRYAGTGRWDGVFLVGLFVATTRLWQEKGWLGPLPKRVPKAFRQAGLRR